MKEVGRKCHLLETGMWGGKKQFVGGLVSKKIRNKIIKHGNSLLLLSNSSAHSDKKSKYKANETRVPENIHL